jgi:hypothetical protein
MANAAPPRRDRLSVLWALAVTAAACRMVWLNAPPRLIGAPPSPASSSRPHYSSSDAQDRLGGRILSDQVTIRPAGWLVGHR